MIHEMLKEAIRGRGIKQKFLANKIGVSETALSAMLNGTQKIDVETFFAISSVIGLTPDEICAFKKGA